MKDEKQYMQELESLSSTVMVHIIIQLRKERNTWIKAAIAGWIVAILVAYFLV